MNDDEYDNDVLNKNEELYYFTNAYFVTEPVFDVRTIEQITT